MIATEASFSKVSNEQLAKLAYVYIRQSSPAQLKHHGESTDLQYQLVERAQALGWPRERIKIIDEDLGKSGASAQARPGFQRLIAEIGLARVGLLVSLDASRVARNNRDWYQLLELCSLFGTLIADSEALYHPGLYQDRMLLGLSGMMSEAELHQLKLRLQAGALNKAKRGELKLPLPAGLTRSQSGEVIFTPDEEVQARLRLIFAKFRELGSARAVARYLGKLKLSVPVRPLSGAAPHPIVWQPASSSRVRDVLKNPAYAGAYVYGRSTTDPTRRQPQRPGSGVVQRPLEAWPVVLHDVYPAYLSWPEFLDIRAKLKANQTRFGAGGKGVAREGRALLQGIIRCARCGMRMYVRYSGGHGEYLAYTCHYANSHYAELPCQEVRAAALDAELEHLVLEALAPDRIALAVAALQELDHEAASLSQQWQLKLERARYETERAQRQYSAVEPENRLVARNLERHWEVKLRELETLEQAYQQWQCQHQQPLSADERAALLALGADLPKLWQAPSTSFADRKQMVRLVVEEVLVDQHRERGMLHYRVNWQTGASSEHSYRRSVHSYAEHPDRAALEARLKALHAETKMDHEIAAALNAEGFKTARGQAFSKNLVWMLRKKWALPSVQAKPATRLRFDDGSYTVQGLAQLLGVFPGTIYTWLHKGKLKGHQLTKATSWKIPLSDEDIAYWQSYISRVNRSKKEAL